MTVKDMLDMFNNYKMYPKEVFGNALSSAACAFEETMCGYLCECINDEENDDENVEKMYEEFDYNDLYKYGMELGLIDKD